MAVRTSDRLLKVEDVMECLGYGRHKVYDLIRSGALPSIKDGKYRRVRESDLASYMKACVEIA